MPFSRAPVELSHQICGGCLFTPHPGAAKLHPIEGRPPPPLGGRGRRERGAAPFRGRFLPKEPFSLRSGPYPSHGEGLISPSSPLLPEGEGAGDEGRNKKPTPERGGSPPSLLVGEGVAQSAGDGGYQGKDFNAIALPPPTFGFPCPGKVCYNAERVLLRREARAPPANRGLYSALSCIVSAERRKAPFFGPVKAGATPLWIGHEP
jgi:hypothetical protein